MASNRQALTPLLALARNPVKARDFVIALRQTEEDYPGSAAAFWSLTKYDPNLISDKAMAMLGDIQERNPAQFRREFWGVFDD